MRIVIASVVTLAAALGACRDGSPGGGTLPAPVLTALEPVVLAERADAPLGLLGGLAVPSSGALVIADRQQGKLVLFRRDGTLAREIGRRGEGPGEWSMGPTTPRLAGDTLVLVNDGASVKALALPDGLERWARPQSPLTTMLGAAHGWVYARGVDRDRRTTLRRYRGTADSAEAGGPFPQHMGRSATVDRFLVWAIPGAYGRDSLAVMVLGSDHLFVGPFAGPYDSVHVPARLRRGAMPQVLGAVDDRDQESMMKAAYTASMPFAVAALSTPGSVAVVTMDQAFLGDRMAGVVHVSVVDVPRRRACPDALVPLPADPMPFPTLRGDTLFVLAPEVDSTALTSRTLVHRFVIDARSCAWTEDPRR